MSLDLRNLSPVEEPTIMASNYEDISTIFNEAIKRPDGPERLSYLDGACGWDEALRREVETLLSALDHGGAITERDSTQALESDLTGAFEPEPRFSQETQKEVVEDGTALLNPAMMENLPDALATTDGGHSAKPHRGGSMLGQVIAGRYRLREILGEGGMGTVYLADQTEPVKRPVALKLIKRGMDSHAVLARFDAERQALALMDHPNIARVYDGGVTVEGQPFFVMELVKGVPINEYCDGHHMTVRGRLELFVAVCQAVQHAHQKGIIHRDLKPGNVLVTEVDGRPSPKVIDFGVAKATEQPLTDMSLDDTGAIVGTPTYMSPEQADPTTIDIDTRTDVYALGVILYELLVGSPPIDARQFKRGAILEMLRMVREVEPPRPSTKLSSAENRQEIAANRGLDPSRLAKSLQGELDWVVMKAIEKDRTRRYETANGLARDIERYLSDETVEARPPSTRYRLEKFVLRHKGQVIAASLLFVSLIGGIIGTSLGMFEARKQKTFAQSEQKRAEESFKTARALILDMGSQLNQSELQKLDPKRADRERKATLEEARRQFDRFLLGRPDDEDILKQAALLNRYAANASRILSDFPGADAAYSSAIGHTEKLVSLFPGEAHYRDELALILSDRAGMERLQGKLKQAAATLDQAEQVAESLKGKLTDWSYQRSLGLIELSRAIVANRLGQFDKGARTAGHALDLFDRLKAAPENLRQITDPLFAVFSVNCLAECQRELGDHARAWATHEDAVARMRSLLGPNPNRDFLYSYCEARFERARTATVIPERRASTVADLLELVPILEKLVADYPDFAAYKKGLATVYLRRGELLLSLGQTELAAAELTKSLAVSRILYDRHGTLTETYLVRGQAFVALGKAQAAAGKPDEAAARWKSAANIFQVALKGDPDNIHHQRGLLDSQPAPKPPAR
jgi:eukaryotic-like serine/threonine-protein kinase